MRGRHVLTAAVLVVPALVATAAPAHAADDRYVATTGSDANSGTSSGAAWRTLQKAVDTAPAGATIHVASGTYAGFSVAAGRTGLSIVGASRTGVVITPSAPARDVVAIRGAGTTLRSVTVSGCRPAPTPSSPETAGTASVRVAAADVTVDQVTIRDATAGGAYPTGCYGVLAVDADRTTVSGSEITRTGTGVMISGGGAGTQVRGNTIHHNDALIRNNPAADTTGEGDFGATGIGFYLVAATPGPVADANTVSDNRAPSYDYGWDGSGIEIFGASRLTLTGNKLANNDTALESGTSGPTGPACLDNVFRGNLVTGNPDRSAGHQVSKGLILRCGKKMQVTENTLRLTDWFALSLVEEDPLFGGTDAQVEGTDIFGNDITQCWDRFLYSGRNPSHISAYWIDGNDYHGIARGPGAPEFARIGTTAYATLPAWRAATPPFDVASTWSDVPAGTC